MTSEGKQTARSTIPESLFSLSLNEVSYSFGITESLILEIVDEGIVNVHKNEKNELIFDHEAIQIIQTTIRLNRDLGVNLAGAGLALELLKEIEHLEMLLQHVNK